MAAVLALSLRSAVLRMGGGILQTLRTEYPDERIEMRPVPPNSESLMYRCLVNGVPVGRVLHMENMVGAAITDGFAESEQRLAQELSDAVMMHLQTQG